MLQGSEYAYVVIVSSLLAKVDVPSGAGPTWAEFGVVTVVVTTGYVALLLARTLVRSILASRSSREVE
jgi:hypothetical protein